MTPAEHLAALVAYRDSRPPVERPRHPSAGCPCTECVERDSRLEHIAEERAWARRHGY